MAVDWIGFGYAALVTSGGLIGYAKAGDLYRLSVTSNPFKGDLRKLEYIEETTPKQQQCPVAGCWAALWKSGWTGRLSALPEPKQCLDFSDYIWNTDCRHGNKILQLWEVHACGADCWCQFANGWKISTEDGGEAPRKVTAHFTAYHPDEEA